MTPCVSIVSSAVAGSNRSTSTTDAPAYEREAEHDVQPEDVEQRQHAEHHVVGPPSPRPGCACIWLEVGEQVAVGEHRRLRRAGGAAREEQHGQVVVGTVDDRRRVGGEQVVERAGIVERVTRGRR